MVPPVRTAGAFATFTWTRKSSALSIRRVGLTDAAFVGYEDVVVQDLRIQSHNIRYRLELWDSSSQGRIRGELPPGVTGEYGPELKALLVSLKYVAGTSLPRRTSSWSTAAW